MSLGTPIIIILLGISIIALSVGIFKYDIFNGHSWVLGLYVGFVIWIPYWLGLSERE